MSVLYLTITVSEFLFCGDFFRNSSVGELYFLIGDLDVQYTQIFIRLYNNIFIATSIQNINNNYINAVKFTSTVIVDLVQKYKIICQFWLMYSSTITLLLQTDVFYYSVRLFQPRLNQHKIHPIRYLSVANNISLLMKICAMNYCLWSLQFYYR